MHDAHLLKARALVQEKNWDGLLVEEPINLYYLTGLDLSLGFLLIQKDKATLAVDGRYLEICQSKQPCEVLLIKDEPRMQLLALCKKKSSIAFDSHSTTYASYLKLEKAAEKFKMTLLPEENPIRLLRMIKDQKEILLLKEAAGLGSQGYDLLLSLLKEGIRESAAAHELELFWKKQGAGGPAFAPIVAFGANSSAPHYSTGEAVLARDQAVLLDLGVIKNHYLSDMSRTLFLGDVDPKLTEAHAIVRKAQAAVLALCRPGASIGLLDQTARHVMIEAGFEESFPHSLGHGIGLEVHEQPLVRNREPWNRWTLRPGMVLTIEPGLYFPGLGGIRIEDTIVITQEGYENLTNRPTDPYIDI